MSALTCRYFSDFCQDLAVGKVSAMCCRFAVSQFQQGLIRIAQTELVIEITETAHGKKFVMDGELETPKGDKIHLRTVWIIETGDSVPRLVTAYPLD
jgi:hypothetical protein